MKRNLFVLLLAVAATATFAPLALADCGKCGHDAAAKKADCPMHAKAETDCPMHAKAEENCPMKQATAKWNTVENGVRVTFTSDKPEVVKALQQHAEKCAGMSGGCCGEMKGEAKAAGGCGHMKAEGKEAGCCGHAKAEGKEAGCCGHKKAEGNVAAFPMKDTKRQVAKIENGVTVTFTSDKQDVVKYLQENAGKCPVLGGKSDAQKT